MAAADKIDVRVNSNSNIAGRYVEVLPFRVGYYGPMELQILDKHRTHDDTRPPITQNDLVELSTDGFSTLKWKGRVTAVAPGGLSEEGITWIAHSLERKMHNRTARWNGRAQSPNFNSNFQTDLTSPGFASAAGAIDTTARWTIGQILIDVLEHAFGINTTERLIASGGFADMPITSAIPTHHVSQYSVTGPYMHLPNGIDRDYLDQLTWTPADILSVLNFSMPNISFIDQPLWSVIEWLVQNGGEHGVFIDPTVITTPALVVHKHSNSVIVSVQSGVLGTHAETPAYRVLDDQFEFSVDETYNIITIQGANKYLTTDPAKTANDPLSGKLVKLDTAGKVWRVQNQDLVPLVPAYADAGATTTLDHRALDITNQNKYKPVLYQGATPYTNQDMIWILDAGVMLSPVTLSSSSDWRMVGVFQTPFQVRVGPAAGSCMQRPATGLGSTVLYPTPGPFDAYANYGVEREMHITLPEFVHPSNNTEQEFLASRTRPEINTGKNDGTKKLARMGRRAIKNAGYTDITQDPLTRDDTGYMVVLAEEYQRRFRDERIRLTLTLTHIDLSGLWDTTVTEPGLRKKISLVNLQGNRWSDAALQVMSVFVDPQQNRLVIEASTDIYNTHARPPAVWQIMEQQRTIREWVMRAKAAQHGDTPAGGDGDGNRHLTAPADGLVQSWPAPANTFGVYTDPGAEPTV